MRHQTALCRKLVSTKLDSTGTYPSIYVRPTRTANSPLIFSKSERETIKSLQSTSRMDPRGAIPASERCFGTGNRSLVAMRSKLSPVI
eukprot:m.191147 g.191147  ORF g.191147 m.191147 type:complete len:88 (+) comp39441_c0_seq36:1068-1331(+)